MRRRAVISLTPLIDVVFILLVFFMLASSFMDWRTLDLGVARAGGGNGMRGALLVELDLGSVRLSGRKVSETELQNILAARFKRDPDQRVLVKPRAGVPLQRAVELVDRIAAVGSKQVSFVSGADR
jgi:biopolymer transport protein ExbD